MITNRWVTDKENLKEIIELRRKIFRFGEDEYDEFSFNLGIYEDDKDLVGIGRLAVIDNKFFVDYIGVKENYRNKKYGDFILRVLLKKAQDIGLKKIYIKCSSEFADYLKRLNFEIEKELNGELLFYWKGDLPHGCCE